MSERTDSDTARSVLQADVNALKRHEIQFWQFMVGLVPNGAVEKIEPAKGSWCDGVNMGILSLKRTVWFVFSMGVLNSFADHVTRGQFEALLRLIQMGAK